MSKEYANKDETLKIEFEIKDTSFSHAFGFKREIDADWTKCEAYIPALDSWIDVTHMSEFSKAADALLNEAFENYQNDYEASRADRAIKAYKEGF